MSKRIGFFVFLAILIIVPTGLFSDSTTQNTIEVFAHDCPWYKVPWYISHHTTPTGGEYDSWEPEVAVRQNNEKNNYGIGVDAISWSGPGSHLERWLLMGYFDASNFHTRKFFFLYEIIPLLGEREVYDFSDPELTEAFLYHIDYIVEKFSCYPNYYKIDGRPVVYIWTGIFKNFKQVSEEIRKKVYLIGPEPILFPPSDDDSERLERLQYWDAITSYDMGQIYLAQKYGGLTVEAIEEYIRAAIKWDRILKLYAPDTELILPMMFNYHDFRGDVDDQGRTRIFTNTLEQADMFAKTVRFLADALKIKRIFFISYNEHYEMTAAEISKEYGDQWLLLIRKYFKDNN